MKFKFTFFLLLTVFIAVAQDSMTYIHAGHLLDTKNGEWQNQMTITVKNDRVSKVEKGFKDVPENGTYINLKDKWVMPGFTDMHVHMETEYNPHAYVAKYVDDPADVAYSSVQYAEITLLSGFTTVRDLGGSGINISLRDAINSGKVPGPRIFTAGKSIATTGGHADPTNGSNQALMGDPGPREGVANSPADGREAVRHRYKNGADCIKITATGGVLSVAKNGSNPQFTIEEIKAITETAADYGFHVAAHAHGDEGMRRAVLGGVKTIEHGTYMSEETMDLMKKMDCYLVPTITAGKEVAEKAEVDGFYPAIVVPKARTVGPQIQGTFARAYKRGVPIVFGTDAGVFAHGKNAKEFGYMVEAGMPAMEAIQSATITPAMILKEENNIGQIQQGFYADIIAVNENPVKNIAILEKVHFVMKDGVVYKR
ncbi:xaa-pro dipeptidase family enzyme [Nonlabens ulvanivorans]|uniref:Xaa-pro dipeptidase family enzyme n=1 Tax=Nonlabens ulvanivorans TaxID=906888 RepID=A0A081D691_NONUL|nr:amidohydrolase family protein [Nonlabens ulvanivorans]GAK74437.1 xaa-pro dipeptidase family enzyme [Nonlabens ulvanivorans]